MQDFISLYFPALSEIPADTLANARSRLETEYSLLFPDLDTRPNSVFGDLWLNPAAQLLASLEIAGDRYKSDLNLGNVAQGIIYDCDFVEQYLRNFSTLQDTRTLASGVIRLVFSGDQGYTLPRNLTFSNEDGNTFNLRLAHPGDLSVLSSGSSRTPGVNQVVLQPRGDGDGFSVDVQVVGEMGTPVLFGVDMEVSEVLPNLVSSTALNTFLPGLSDNRLSAVARLTRDTFYSATPSTKGGMRSYLRRQFPDILGVSAVSPGDDTMVRDVDATKRYLDVYLRGPQTTEDTLVVRAKLDGGTDKFVAEIPQSIPCVLVEDIGVADDPEFALDPSTLETFYRPADDSQAPGWSGAYSEGQRVYFTLEMPRDPVTNDPLITTEVLGGDEYADFQVTLRIDPLFPAIAEHMLGEDQRILGVDTLYRQPCVIRISQLLVQYRREPGTRVKLEQARQEIHGYISNLMFPQVLTEARVYDSLFYAGVTDVQGVSLQARVLWGPGTSWVPTGAPDPLSDLPGFLSAATEGTQVNFTNLQELLNNVAGADYAVCGPENYRLLLDAQDIVFQEVV